MMKMLIKLDIPYSQDDAIWQELDGIFAEQGCDKVLQTDGSVLYDGNHYSDNNFVEFGVLYVKLSDNVKFMEHATKWVLFDNDDDDKLPLQETDILHEMNAFKMAYGG